MLKKLIMAAMSLAFVSAGAMAEVKADFEKSGLSAKDIAGSPAVSSIEVPAAVPAPAKTAVAKDAKDGLEGAPKEWTIMVFINGKNNLEQFGIFNFDQMKKVAGSDKINLVVEMGRIKGYDTSNGDWTGCRRFLVQKDTDLSSASAALQVIDKCDMGDYNHAVEFGQWAMSKFPAKHYMYVVWNHGAGWVKSRDGDGIFKGISYDDETNHHINTPQLGQLMGALGHVDVYGSDACLMQMAEVVWQIKDRADYIVGSEETEGGDGWTYDAWLNKFLKSGDLSAASLATTLVDTYVEHYSSKATLSYVDTAALPKFATLLNDFASAIMKENNRTAVKDALRKTQKYTYSDNKDLYHFALNIAAASSDEAVKDSAAALMGHMKDTLIPNNKVTSDYSDSYGLAVYIPEYSFRSSYNDIAFAKDSKWPAFIQWVLAKE
ncbi:MAG: clostripain-related cysteine peptidase [Elusimicrobiales bacterium]|nr:clostripain-related cysteine peptidase [Elusimicrobiales bacterium]